MYAPYDMAVYHVGYDMYSQYDMAVYQVGHKMYAQMDTSLFVHRWRGIQLEMFASLACTCV